MEWGGLADRTAPLDEQTLLRVLHGSSVEMLLRGHLFVEQRLVAVLHEVLPFPQQVDFDRMRFPAMVRLASALGLANVGPDDVPALLKLNALRNRLAHRLDWEPDEAAENEMLNSLSPKLRHIAFGEKRPGDFEFPEAMRQIIATLVIALEGTRTRLIEHRAELARQHQEVVDLLGYDPSEK